LRFAVHWPGTPEASPRSHGVPRRDVLGSIHVGVAGVAAGSAPEDGLALARVPIHLPTRRAPLARECWFDAFYPAWCLLLQAAHQQSPSRPQDAPVQPGFLANILAWALRGTLPGPGHGLDPQVFHPDHVEPLGDIRRCLLGPILAPVCISGAEASDGMLDPCAALRSPRGTGELALQALQAPTLLRCQVTDAQQLSCRQGSGHGHAPVDAHHPAVTRCRNGFGNGCEGHVPPPGAVHGHTVRFHPRRHLPRPAEPHPPNLRHPHLAHMARNSAHIPLPAAAPHDPKSFVQPSLAPARPSGWVLRVEECAHGLCEVPQHRLLSGSREQSIPRHVYTLTTTADISEEVKRRFLPRMKTGVSRPRSR
jgi:hypothetical protein